MPKTSKTNNIVSAKRLVIIFLVLLAAAGFFWWTKVFNNSRNVFLGMLENSLATSSVTRQINQLAPGSSVDILSRQQTGSVNASQALETTKQGQTTVAKETVGTPNADYARYASIVTDQKSADGKPVDFSSVQGVWGKSSSDQGDQVQYFSQAILGTVPFASLDSDARRELLDFMRENNVYNVSYSDVGKAKEQGRKIYTYKVKINPSSYFSMLQLFVKKLGLPEIASLDPSRYAGVADLETEFKIDKNSRQLVSIKFVNSGQQEFYSNHGLATPIEVPKETIPFNELQTRIQNLQ